jgi:general secretion pathway protein J
MKSQSGFTLLELLIAMTLMSLVLVLLYGGLRLTTRGWESGEESAEKLNEISLVHDFIRRQLQQSLTVFRDDPNQGRIVVFAGESARISVVAPMLSYLGLGGLYVIELNVSGTEGAGQLHMRWYPYRPSAQDSGNEGGETILLEGISDLRWAYFGFEQNEQIPQWHDRWQDSERRPILVRLSLKWRGEPWPDLVAALPD